MRRVIVAVLGIFVVIGIVACALGANVVVAPTATPRIVVQSAPSLQPAPSQATDNADMTVTLSERYMNKNIARGLAQGGQVQSAQLDIQSNAVVVIDAVVQVNPQLRLSPRVTTQLTVENGRIVVNVQKVDVGGFGVPSNLIEPQINQMKQNAETNLNTQLANFTASSGLKLQALSTTENSLSLFFVG